MAATTIDHRGVILQFRGTGTADNEVVIQTNDVLQYGEFTLMSTGGVLDVYVSLDGTNYATAALSLIDCGATTTDPVIETAAARVYQFFGAFSAVRVLQKGAVAVTAATLNCAPRVHN